MFKQINISRFGAINEADLEFSPGINVFLGENSTGKTFVLKLMYCLASAVIALKELKIPSDDLTLEDVVEARLSNIFRPENHIGRLVRRGRGRGRGTARVHSSFDGGNLDFSLNSQGKLSVNSSEGLVVQESLYLPSREILSIFRGFVSSYVKRESPFDATYYDLAISLGLLPVLGARAREASALYRPLNEHLGGSVVFRGDQFYLRSETEGLIEAPLLAEGIRKIATLMHLISNGSLTKQTLLFWDEPEANLNPKLIKIVADFLVNLARNGVQVFIASHDYLLTNELSLWSEYATSQPSGPGVRFFAFTRMEDGVVAQTGRTLAEIDTNPIMDEFAAFYERERQLFENEHPV